MTKIKDVFKKAERVKEILSKEISIDKVSHVYIEQNLQSFRSGFSSAQTLSTLARFNGIVSYIMFQITGISPEYLNVNSARKTVGLKIDRKSEASTKDQVFDWTREKIALSSYSWPVKILKSGPRKGQKIFDPVCYDISDAYVIALAGHIMNKGALAV